MIAINKLVTVRPALDSVWICDKYNSFFQNEHLMFLYMWDNISAIRTDRTTYLIIEQSIFCSNKKVVLRKHKISSSGNAYTLFEPM